MSLPLSLSPAAAFALGLIAKATLVLAAAWVASAVLTRLRAPAAARHLAWTVAVCAVLALPLLSLAMPAWRVGFITLRQAMPSLSAAPADVADASPALQPAYAPIAPPADVAFAPVAVSAVAPAVSVNYAADAPPPLPPTATPAAATTTVTEIVAVPADLAPPAPPAMAPLAALPHAAFGGGGGAGSGFASLPAPWAAVTLGRSSG